MCQVVHLSIMYQVVAKRYPECPFAVEIGMRFVAQKKKGDHANTLKVINKMRARPKGFSSTALAFEK